MTIATDGFLSDGKKRSHSRLLVMICVPPLVLIPLLSSLVISILNHEPMKIDPTIPLYLTAANGIVLIYAGYKQSQETKTAVQPTQ